MFQSVELCRLTERHLSFVRGYKHFAPPEQNSVAAGTFRTKPILDASGDFGSRYSQQLCSNCQLENTFIAGEDGFEKTRVPPEVAEKTQNSKVESYVEDSTSMRCFQLLAVGTLLCLFPARLCTASRSCSGPARPAGQPTRKLPSTTRATLPPHSPADVKFMQDMIMHHAQAVEMTALIESHTENKELRSLGARISRSQSDEIAFMKRWLQARGEQTSMPMPRTVHIRRAIRCSCPACLRQSKWTR